MCPLICLSSHSSYKTQYSHHCDWMFIWIFTPICDKEMISFWLCWWPVYRETAWYEYFSLFPLICDGHLGVLTLMIAFKRTRGLTNGLSFRRMSCKSCKKKGFNSHNKTKTNETKMWKWASEVSHHWPEIKIFTVALRKHIIGRQIYFPCWSLSLKKKEARMLKLHFSFGSSIVWAM